MSNFNIEPPKFIVSIYADGYAEYANNYKNGLGSFKPVTTSFMNKLAVATKEEFNISGLTPKEMVGFKQIGKAYKIAFITNPCQKKIRFSKKQASVKFPKMLWLYDASASSLELYSISRKYVSPIKFSNVSNGRVCIGTSPHPESTNFKGIYKELLEMFFDGVFTHSGAQVQVVEQKYELWKTVSKFLNTL